MRLSRLLIVAIVLLLVASTMASAIVYEKDIVYWSGSRYRQGTLGFLSTAGLLKTTANTWSAANTYSGASAQLLTGKNAAGGSANPWDYTATLGIMNGTDDFTLFDVNLTNADHTGSTNTVQIMDVANITGDAHATETAIKIGTGWDAGISSGSPITATGSASGGISIAPIATGTGTARLINQNVANSDITLPSATCTLPGLGLNNTWTGTQAFNGAVTDGSTVTGPGAGAAVYRKLVTKTRAELIAGGFYGNGTDAGVEILPAVTGRSYRVINARVYAGTAALTATATASGVRLVSNYTPGATGTILFEVPIANLIRATAEGTGYNPMIPVTTNNVLLIDGGSFATQTAAKSIILISMAGVDWLGTNATINVDIEYVVL